MVIDAVRGMAAEVFVFDDGLEAVAGKGYIGDGGGGGNGGNGTSTTVSFFVSGLSVVVVSFFTFSFSSLLLLQEATAKSNVANDKRPMTFFIKKNLSYKFVYRGNLPR